MKTVISANKNLLLEAVFLILAMAVVILMGWPRLYAASGDLALHYDLANSISKNWMWPSWGKPLDSAMTNYPPLAHYLAAAAGKPFHSALIGLIVVSALCVFLIYLLLTEAILAGSLAGSAAALLVTGAVLAYGRSQLALIGFEVFRNFFYAQIVGEWAFLIVTWWMCRTRSGWVVRLAVAAAAVFIGGWLYLFSSVLTALAYLVLETYWLGLRVRAERRLKASWMAPVVAGGILLPLLIYVHPQYQTMVTIAGNNGALDLGRVGGFTPALALALLVISIVLALVARDKERWRKGSLFLATAGGATATGALLQSFAYFVLHIGSDYAIKKYGFSVITLLAFGSGAVAATIVELRFQRLLPRSAATILASFLAMVVALKLPPNLPVDLKDFLRYERAIQATMMGPQLPADIRGQVMSRYQHYPWYLNYASSLVDLGARAQKSFDAATHPDRDFSERELAPYVFTENSDKAIPAKCILSKPAFADIALVSTACIVKTGDELEPGTTLDMASLLRRPIYFASGWSDKEPSGFWNDGASATVVMHFDPALETALLSFDVAAFIASQDAVQHVTASVDGKPVGQWLFDAKNFSGTMTVAIPRALMTNNAVKIDFSFPDAVRPADRKLSGDTRRLAIFVRGVSLGGSKPLRIGEAVNLADRIGKPSHFGAGWSIKEGSWIWNESGRASLTITPAEREGPVFLTFDGAAFIPEKGYVQHVVLSVDGHEVGRWQYDAASPSGQRSVTIPRELIHGGEFKLDLDFPNATSPADHKMSADVRKLAYRITSFASGDPNRPLRAGETFLVQAGPALAIKFASGWSIQEPEGRWTEGKRASLSLHVEKPAQPAVKLDVDVNAYIAGPDKVQRVAVSSAGRHLADWIYDSKSPGGARTVSVPSELIKPSGELTLDFDLPDATSPAQNKASADPRQLGIFVKSFSLTR